MKERIKEKIIKIKYYFNILRDFSKLNKYIFYSSIFVNRVEELLSSDLSDSVILDNIKMSFSDYKVNFLEENFSNFTNVNNNFDTSSR